MVHISETILRWLEEAAAACGDGVLLALLAADGMLVRRPLLVLEDSVLVGFREDAWNKVLGQNVT